MFLKKQKFHRLFLVFFGFNTFQPSVNAVVGFSRCYEKTLAVVRKSMHFFGGNGWETFYGVSLGKWSFQSHEAYMNFSEKKLNRFRVQIARLDGLWVPAGTETQYLGTSISDPTALVGHTIVGIEENISNGEFEIFGGTVLSVDPSFEHHTLDWFEITLQRNNQIFRLLYPALSHVHILKRSRES